MKMIKQGILAAVASVGLVSAASAATITNGSFEDNNYVDNANGFNTLGTGNTSIDGWTVGSGSVDLIEDYWKASEGDYSLDLAGNASGSIFTTITGLEEGKTYVISFDVSGNPDNGPTEKQTTIAVGLSGDTVYTYDTAANGNTRADMKWDPQTFTFTYAYDAGNDPGLGMTRLSFQNGTPGPYGFALDNVSIAAVPVPAAGLLLLGGLGGLAAIRRRRKAA